VRSFLYWLAVVIGLAVINYITGKLGLLLAIPPGYATAIWVPSGVALAAILLFGDRVWPGIWIASFLFNLSVGQEPFNFSSNSLIIAGSIAFGSTLQAIIGAYFIRKVVPFPNAFEKDRNILYLILIGVLSCVVATTWGNITLIIFGSIPPESFIFGWLTWWIGDAIGVLIFTPLILLWFTLLPKKKFFRLFAVTTPLVCTFFLAILLFLFASRWEQRDIKNRFENESRDVADQIEYNLQKSLNFVWFIEDFIQTANQVTHQNFHQFVGSAVARFSVVQAVSWVTMISEENRLGFEKGIQNEGFPGFEIKELTDHQLVRAASRKAYAPIVYIEPPEGNGLALGLDVNSEPVRSETLAIAKQTGEMTASSRLVLVQDLHSDTLDYAILLATPIYKQVGSGIKDLNSENLKGFILTVFRVKDIVRRDSIKDSDLIVQVFDITLGSQPNQELLYSNSKKDEPGGLKWSKSINFASRKWRIDVVLPESALIKNKTWQSWIVLTAGFFFTGLLGLLTYGITGRAALIENLYDELHKRFSDNEKRLQTILYTMIDGIVTFDISNRVLSLNKSGEKMFGYKKEVEEMRGLSIKQLFTTAFQPFFDELQVRTFNEDKSDVVCVDKPCEGKKSTGETFNAELSLSTFAIEKRRIFVALIRDVTESKEAQNQINAMVFALEESNRELEQFTYLTSHDLKAPLINLKGFLIELEKSHQKLGSIFAEKITPDTHENTIIQTCMQEIHEYIQYIHNAVHTLEILTNGILQLSRLGHKVLQFENVHTQDLVENILATYQNVIKQKNIQISVGDLPDVTADFLSLQQIFGNIIDNAIKYLDPSRPGKITISGSREASITRFEISDNGIGLNETDQKRLFTLFYRGVNKNIPGEGVGMAFVRTLVRRQGGTITCESTFGKGATFTFTILTHPQESVSWKI